ncbi:hypothetical protein [Rhizobium sp. X9]|uniref:hypothetical protein n=1 Tax=Rhizobium sp. X9 TaxID=2815360 RepID=UPI001C0ADE80|nr:hypothetical protein [Rhizobium sp. X9]
MIAATGTRLSQWVKLRGIVKNDTAALTQTFAIGRRKEHGASLTPQRHAASMTKPNHAPGLRGKQGDERPHAAWDSTTF